MNPLIKAVAGAYVRHLITIVITLLVARHYIGADIADKLNHGDTVTLWNGYNLSIQTIMDYVFITLIPASLPILVSAWKAIKARFRILTALQTSNPTALNNIVASSTPAEIIKVVATSPSVL